MEKKNVKPILEDFLEEKIPTSQVNLWLGVKERLVVAGEHQSLQQGEKMNTTKSRRLLRIAFAALLITALLAITFTTPQGRAFAQSVLQFFVRADQDRYPLQPWQMTPPANPSSESPFQLSVQKAESLAGYDVLSPAEIPFGMKFIGASYDAKHHIVAQAFGPDAASNVLSLWQQPLEYNQSCGDISNLCDNMLGGNLVGASANLETVQIGDVAGEYVEGVWNLTNDGPVWINTPDLKTLRWQTDKLVFELVYMGMGLEKDDLVALAASIR